MDSTVAQLRALQFLAHRAHNVVKGTTFFEDHEFFGELYPAYEKAYDDLVERIIGTNAESLSICKVNKAAAEMSSVSPNETNPEAFFRIILKGEKDLCAMIEESIEEQTQGTQNLLAQIADDSEKRIYSLKQRLAIA
jgi:DNA-binding ferritin-like protein